MPKILPEYQVQIDCLENLILQAPFLEREIADTIQLLKRSEILQNELEEYKVSDKSKEESSIEYYNLYKETKRQLKKVEEFIINVFIECDELGIEPTTLTNENGKDIVTRWRKELEALDNV